MYISHFRSARVPVLYAKLEQIVRRVKNLTNTTQAVQYNKCLSERRIQQMLQKLASESENRCLKMNKSKTKVMMENDTPINYVNNTQIESVESYIYLAVAYVARVRLGGHGHPSRKIGGERRNNNWLPDSQSHKIQTV